MGMVSREELQSDIGATFDRIQAVKAELGSGQESGQERRRELKELQYLQLWQLEQLERRTPEA
jgi:hypothetical protein